MQHNVVVPGKESLAGLPYSPVLVTQPLLPLQQVRNFCSHKVFLQHSTAQSTGSRSPS